MIAKVVVDVPVKQTNRPFDYVVPEPLIPWARIGSRVAVPFGPRLVQGFIVELVPGEPSPQGLQSHDAPRQLKQLDQVLDIHPPLTEELVRLAEWMKDRYLCHYSTALQAMIPGALKAKAERTVRPGEQHPLQQAFLSEDERSLLEYVRSKQPVPLAALLERFPHLSGRVREWLDDGTLVEEQVLKDRVSRKKVLTVFPPDGQEGYSLERVDLPKQATRQLEVLSYLREHPEPIALADLTAKLKVGSGTVKSLADKGLLSLRYVEVSRDPYAGRRFVRTTPLPLTEEQAKALGPVKEAVLANRHEVFLLHGVTGSGKTEVYLQAIQACLDQGREAIVLVPEISLTPQMVERFKGRFGDDVAVLHSRLSQGERYDEWRKITRREVKVVIGARSAIFAPLTRIGLIIIDEEHESSYKQEESPKYHAKEVAIRRAEHFGATVVLGSATPSLESWHEAVPSSQGGMGRFRLLSMKERVEGRALPRVQLVDMREELKAGNRSMFSRALHDGLQQRLDRREQTVLLLNRRGYSTFVMCRTCGHTIRCPHCEISLTYHLNARMLRCHYCGFADRQPTECPACGSAHIRYFGTGTQRVEEELAKLFPGIRVIRMDVDTTSTKGAHEQLLSAFRDKKADVLLGTQMVAKGLDFPDVTLVGVIAADTVLHLPDFRSAEKTFQLLTQVAGRAGRHHLPGEVIIQTYTPEHYSIQAAGRHDYAEFVGMEMGLRRMAGYPPYSRLILVTFSHEEQLLVAKTAESFAKRARELAAQAGFAVSANVHVGHQGKSLTLLGPVPSPIPRIKDRYRFQLMIKYRGEQEVSALIGRVADDFEDVVRTRKLQISIDVDPQVLM